MIAVDTLGRWTGDPRRPQPTGIPKHSANRKAQRRFPVSTAFSNSKRRSQPGATPSAQSVERRAGRPTELTPEVHAKIARHIRAGAFDWVAACACGISSATFYRWMQWGAEGRAEFREFREDVLTARAEARVVAEIEVRKTSPFNWLRYGPGRDRPEEPGWTADSFGAKIEVTTVVTLIDQVAAVVQRELADDPERLRRIADQFAKLTAEATGERDGFHGK